MNTIFKQIEQDSVTKSNRINDLTIALAQAIINMDRARDILKTTREGDWNILDTDKYREVLNNKTN